MVPRVITLAIGLFLGPYLQSPPFENQAISRVRLLSVAQLDSGLRERSFASWLQQVVGPHAGITWQLTECGEQSAEPGAIGEIEACVEMSALLPDERKVVVLIWVGSFKRGLYGEPKVKFAVVESEGELFEASRLGDLPQMLRKQLRKPLLRTPVRQSFRSTPAPIVLPVINIDRFFPAFDQPLPSRVILDKSIIVTSEESSSVDQPRKVSEGVLLGSVSTRVLPAYPPFAKQLRVSGEVKVEVIINAKGRVIAAQAISGPYPLRLTAEDAALKWTFKPTLLNQVPVSVRGFLTFIFTKP
jgi:TonB family protein